MFIPQFAGVSSLGSKQTCSDETVNEHDQKHTIFLFLTRSNIARALQKQKMARGLNIRIQDENGLCSTMYRKQRR